MIEFLKWLFMGHVHKWRIIDEKSLTIKDELGFSRTGTRYYLQCEKCGKVKKMDIV